MVGWEEYIKRQIDPALLFVASKKMASKGPAEDSMTLSTSLRTKRRQVRKMKPVNTPMPTHAIMILGPSTVGFGISCIASAS